MFLKRTLSGVILVLLALFLLWAGGPILLISLLALSLIGTYELLRALSMQKDHIGIVAYLAVITYYALLYFKQQQMFIALFVGLLIVLLIIYVLTYPRYKTENIALVFFVVLYVGVLMSYVYQVRALKDGWLLVWLIFIGAWGTDTAAYLTGMCIGKHHMKNALSPKKTIEGCVGGVIGAALLGFGFSFVYPGHEMFYMSPMLLFPITTAFGSVVSQFGDLAASAIKRNHDIKDYGDIIPGHGGVLDRFDSIIFVAPVVYYLLVGLSSLKF